ncbi:hypothetical protein [Aeromonas phage Akh-2]|nr:hypothetical protein [Aeromonas phage Akh-2]
MVHKGSVELVSSSIRLLMQLQISTWHLRIVSSSVLLVHSKLFMTVLPSIGLVTHRLLGLECGMVVLGLLQH